ncbi:hypothetical protein DV515_00019305 [Chloebia gouldiae]|uniref:Uncharacterized protein n=1 Tax=Chloebia gouldiae TaxID=44316 RepID=A0A3L8Q542_CHLGU|nr:hypothetical protein DV515_00019305 [Chloebia gouldiae]
MGAEGIWGPPHPPNVPRSQKLKLPWTLQVREGIWGSSDPPKCALFPGARAPEGAGGIWGPPDPPDVPCSQEPELQRALELALCPCCQMPELVWVLLVQEVFWGPATPQMCRYQDPELQRGFWGPPDPPMCPIPRSWSCRRSGNGH